MILRIFQIVFVFLLVCVAGCQKLSDEDLWIRVEAAKVNNNWDSTKQVCEKILSEYPKGRYASWARFGLAESFRFKNQPREALNNYKLFYQQYPDMQPSALSLFLVGYIYKNNFQMIDSAKFFFQAFLIKYPNHDLAPTVRTELNFIGGSPDQVLDGVKQKQKMSKK